MDSQKNRAQHARQRLDMIENFIASGQSQKQFCLEAGINYATFQYWLKKYRTQRPTPTHEQRIENTFVPLTFGNPERSMHAQREQRTIAYTIEYRNGVTLHITHPVDPRQLAQFITALDN